MCRYGEPIAIDDIGPALLADDDAREREAVRSLTTRLETALVELTINAPSDDPSAWDVVYTARMARDMLWNAPEHLPLKNWVRVNQTYVYPSFVPRASHAW